MAAAFLTALAQVPWGQVIDHAPKLVEQAQKLIANAHTSAVVAPPAPQPSSEVQEVRTQLQTMTREQAELRRDLEQASVLLADLTKTNQILVAKLTQWQSWFWGVAGFSAASLVISVIALLR